jgi:hypothetical protein
MQPIDELSVEKDSFTLEALIAYQLGIDAAGLANIGRSFYNRATVRKNRQLVVGSRYPQPKFVHTDVAQVS